MSGVSKQRHSAHVAALFEAAQQQAGVQIERRNRLNAVEKLYRAAVELRLAIGEVREVLDGNWTDPLWMKLERLRPTITDPFALRAWTGPMLAEMARLEREDRALPDEDMDAAVNRVMLELGASADDVAAVDIVDHDDIRDSAERRKANRDRRRRLDAETAKLREIEAEIKRREKHGFLLGRAELHARKVRQREKVELLAKRVKIRRSKKRVRTLKAR